MAWWKQIAVALVVAAVSFGGWWAVAPVAETDDGQGGWGDSGPSPVEVFPARASGIQKTVLAMGSVQARERVDITAPASGRITEIAFTEGSRVEAGERLFSLDNAQEEAELAEARAELEELQNKLARARRLADRDSGPQSRVSELASQVAAARSRRDRAQIALADRTIAAPFAGRIGLREVSQGARVQAGDVVATLTAGPPLEVTFQVPERHLPAVQPGTQVRVTGAASPGRDRVGEVAQIATRVATGSRTGRVIAALDERASEGLRPGMSASVELVIADRPDAVLVPQAALIMRGDTKRLFVVTEAGKLAEREVTTGIRRAGLVAIRDGVSAGERVVLTGFQGADDGDAVRVTASYDNLTTFRNNLPAMGRGPAEGES